MSVQTLTQNKSFNLVLTLVLMVGSAALVLFDIDASVRICYALFALLHGSPDAVVTVAATLTFVLGLLGLIFIIVTFEYHIRRVGTPASRKLFAYCLAAQLTLFLVGYMLA